MIISPYFHYGASLKANTSRLFYFQYTCWGLFKWATPFKFSSNVIIYTKTCTSIWNPRSATIVSKNYCRGMQNSRRARLRLSKAIFLYIIMWQFEPWPDGQRQDKFSCFYGGRKYELHVALNHRCKYLLASTERNRIYEKHPNLSSSWYSDLIFLILYLRHSIPKHYHDHQHPSSRFVYDRANAFCVALHILWGCLSAN